MKILVVVDGKLSILDCGRFSRRMGREAIVSTIETVISPLGSSGSEASPQPDGGDPRDAQHDLYQDEEGEG